MPAKLVRRKRPVQHHANGTQVSVPCDASSDISASHSDPALPVTQEKDNAAPPHPTVRKVVRKKKVIMSEPSDIQFAPIGGSTIVPGARPSSPSITPTTSDPNIDLCTDVPLVDLVPTSASSGSLSSVKSGTKRRKLDPSLSVFEYSETGEDEDDEIVSDDYDLSRVKELEARTLLNRGASEKNREFFMKRMRARLEEHQKTYTPPTQRTECEKVDRVFLQRELENVIKITADSIHSYVSEYDPNKCELPQCSIIPPKSSLHFDMNNDLLDVANLDMPTLLKMLNAEYLRPGELEKPQNIDVLERISGLIILSSKQVSNKTAMIDLSSSRAGELVTEVASFIANGLKLSMQEMLNKLAAKISEDSCERPNLVALHEAIVKAKGAAKDQSALRSAGQFVVSLLKDRHLSVLFRYLGDAVKLKRQLYYSDADIHDFVTCTNLSTLVEKMECMDIQGDLRVSNIPKYTTPVSLEKMLRRITTVINEYKAQMTVWLIQGVDIGRYQLDLLTEIAKVYFNVILCREDGGQASIDSIWDIYDGIAQTGCLHSAFPQYMEAYKEVKRRTLLSAAKRGILMTYLLLQSQILPYVFVFLAQFTLRSTFFIPRYWKIESGKNTCSTAALKLALSFLSLKIPLTIDESTFCARVKDVIGA